MGFYDGFDRHFKNDTRSAPVWHYILVSMLGVICGGILIFLMVFFVFPEELLAEPLENQQNQQNQQNENGEANNREPSGEEEKNDSELLKPRDEAVVSAVEKVSPAVVGIINHRQVSDFWGREIIQEGVGSGVVINEDGLIVTNYHVVEGAREIEVIFKDRTAEDAAIVGTDPETDLAILEVEGRQDLDHVEITDASKKVRPGETAIAIGNPLGMELEQTVTVGVVSALERQVAMPGSEFTYSYIQTDAAINQGNSGGPLINRRGEVIGINSAKLGGLDIEGIGFAIPATTVNRVAGDIVEEGRVLRPHMGIIITDYSEITGERTDRGVYIDRVEAGSPADEAGLERQDVIVGINGRQIDYYAQLFDELLNYYPGDRIEVTVVRDDEKITNEVSLGNN